MEIIEKIQKLLALSKSSNENEAKHAMLKAQELLVKYKLSMADVESHKLNMPKIIDGCTEISFTKARWKGTLARIIADNFGCYHYFKTYYSHTIVFMGKEEDVNVCIIVYQYALDCIKSAVNSLKYQYKKNGRSTAGLETDYAIGFLTGLEQNFEEQKRANQEWGLVLQKDIHVVEAYNNKEFSGSINTKSTFSGHYNVYDKGKQDGKEFSIADKIAEGKDSTKLIGSAV